MQLRCNDECKQNNMTGYITQISFRLTKPTQNARSFSLIGRTRSARLGIETHLRSSRAKVGLSPSLDRERTRCQRVWVVVIDHALEGRISSMMMLQNLQVPRADTTPLSRRVRPSAGKRNSSNASSWEEVIERTVFERICGSGVGGNGEGGSLSGGKVVQPAVLSRSGLESRK
jgi:hypothetical protein